MAMDVDVIAPFHQAPAHLAESGYAVEEVAVPDLDGVWQLWCNLIMTELSALPEGQMRQVGSQDFQQTMYGFL